LYSALAVRFHQVLAQHHQQMVAVVDHHVELAVVVLLEFEAVGDAEKSGWYFLAKSSSGMITLAPAASGIV
jgi:hypothetical protein